VVKNRIARFLGLAAAAAVLAACSSANLFYSNLGFAYSNAAPMLTWTVDDYVDLSDGQKDWVRQRLDRLMSWHRSRELPQYHRFLARFDASLDGGLTVDEVRTAQGEMRRHYHRLVEQVLPYAADFLLQLDAEQVEGLERKFVEANRKTVKESGANTEQRRARAIRTAIDHLEVWTGTLEASQRELVATHLRALPDTGAERMADRRYRQAETLALIRARPDRQVMVAGLRRLLVDTESWRRPDYLRKLQERDTRNFEMLAALGNSLSPEQLANVHRRLRGFMADITALSATASVKPAT
jgi:hypothetical protein